MQPTKTEIDQVSNLPPFDRYQYTIKKIVDTETLCYLTDPKGKWALAVVDGNTVFSIWPYNEFAELSLTKEWTNYSIADISLKDFTRKMIEEIRQNRFLINVLPTNETAGFIVDTDELIIDLADELTKLK